MSPLLQSSLALALGGAAAVAVVALERARPRLFHRSHPVLTWALVAASVVGAAVAPVHPTGIDAVDVAYRVLFAVVVTLAAGRARRNAWLVAGAAAAIGTIGTWPWILFAFAALGLATGAATVRRPARPLGVLIGGLLVQALLRLSWPDVPYVTALLAGLAAVVLVVSGVRHARRRERRPARLVLGLVGGVGLVAGALVAIGVFTIQADLVSGARAADAGLDAMRVGETATAVEQLERAQRRLGAGEDGLRAAWLRPARLLPVVGRYLEAGQQVTESANAVLAPALESARLADSDALRIEGARVDLDAIASLEPPLVRTLAAVPAARASLAELQAEELPGPVARRVDDFDDSLRRATDEGEVALDALDLVPQLLGADSPRRWFVLMQTPSEQRASGGIAGGFGELLVQDGSLDMVRSGPANELNRAGEDDWQLGPVAEEYQRFAGFGPERYFQNVTNVPHFPSVGRVVSEVYPQAGGAPVDGVISVDPKVLAALLSFTGPVEVPTWPQPITAENAERILLYEQYRQLDGPEGNVFITQVIQATFDRLQSSTLPAPGKLLHTLSPLVQAGRLKLYSATPAEQELFAETGLTGAMPEVDGDFFQLVTQNSGESKIDWFQRRTVDYQVRHDPLTGFVDATATVTITNNAPAEGESDLLIGGRFDEPGPAGRSRLYVDFYSALDLSAATVDGEPVGLHHESAYDRNLYWTVHTLLPGQTVTFELYLSGVLEPGAPYELDLGMQPVVNPDQVTVSVQPTAGSAIDSADGLRVRNEIATSRFTQLRPRTFAVHPLR